MESVCIQADDIPLHLNQFLSHHFTGVVFPNVNLMTGDHLLSDVRNFQHSDINFEKTVPYGCWATSPYASRLNRSSTNKRFRIDSLDFTDRLSAKRARLDMTSSTNQKI